MVDEVNRLVGNLLAGGDGVFLPGAGALFVERRGARRLSKRSIQPPCRVVSFSSQPRGESLVDALARTVQCDAAEAQDIYDRWFARTCEGEVLTIEGVGVLKFKNFTPDPAFDRLLNPQGHEPVRIKTVRKFDWAMWVGIVAILIAGGFGGAEFLRTNAYDTPVSGAATEIAEKTPAAGAEIPADTLGLDESGASGAAAAEDAHAGRTTAAGTTSATTAAQAADGTNARTDAAVPASRPDAKGADAESSAARPARPSAELVETIRGTAAEPARLVSGHRYVVLGVYSTPENAARAAADAEAKEASVRCGIYRFGEKFMVSPFEAPDAEACTLFIRNYSGRFPGLWTYTAR